MITPQTSHYEHATLLELIKTDHKVILNLKVVISNGAVLVKEIQWDLSVPDILGHPY